MRPSVHLRRHVLLLLLVPLLLASCSGGGPAVRYYLVDPVDYTDTPVAPDTGPIIEILEVQVPQYLERFHIATRREENQLHFAETSQWGENLRKNLLRTLARNLAQLLGSNDVSTPLNRSMSLPDYRIQVHIEQFERDSDGIVRLAARWQVSGAKSVVPVMTLKEDLQGDGRVAENDYDGIVAVMQQLFGQLSQKIAESVQKAAANPGQRDPA